MTTGVGPLGPHGIRRVRGWATPAAATARAAHLTARYRADRTEVVRNPHLTAEWARHAVRSPVLLNAVRRAIGPDIAVENTFLVIKWPGHPFEVPWHQDGINDRIMLDPRRSVAAWLALTNADETSGCLRVIPGSQQHGYRQYGTEPDAGAARGRALSVGGIDTAQAQALPSQGGDGCLMDVRLVHSSASNTGAGVRIGLNIRFVAPDGYSVRDGSDPSLYPVSGTGW
ncbi:phytanoyl-CoA dioxygenase family protein [Streptomyces sp. NPDC014870]|uniref:phytanoyl-CoA dioxygenase family protein n=1 Tax=Streptomyces sp. NPDC014870 TaxID=3364925 RepID=UPI003700F282